MAAPQPQSWWDQATSSVSAWWKQNAQPLVDQASLAVTKALNLQPEAAPLVVETTGPIKPGVTSSVYFRPAALPAPAPAPQPSPSPAPMGESPPSYGSFSNEQKLPGSIAGFLHGLPTPSMASVPGVPVGPSTSPNTKAVYMQGIVQGGGPVAFDTRYDLAAANAKATVNPLRLGYGSTVDEDLATKAISSSYGEVA